MALAWLTTAAVGAARADAGSPLQEEPVPNEGSTGPGRFLLGFNGVYGSPQGEFRRYVDRGFGFVFHGSMGFGPARAVGFRIELGALEYGRETVEKPFSSTVGRVTVEVTTSNTIGLLGAGPYVMLPLGRVRPYGYGTVGLAYFATHSSVTGQNDTVPIAESKNFDAATHAYVAGLGVAILVAGGDKPVALDLGVQHRWQGKTRYSREGSIQEDGSGNISFTPIESRTNLLMFWLGVSVGLR